MYVNRKVPPRVDHQDPHEGRHPHRDANCLLAGTGGRIHAVKASSACSDPLHGARREPRLRALEPRSAGVTSLSGRGRRPPSRPAATSTYGNAIELGRHGVASFPCGGHSAISAGSEVVPIGWDDTIGHVTCQVRGFGVDCFSKAQPRLHHQPHRLRRCTEWPSAERGGRS